VPILSKARAAAARPSHLKALVYGEPGVGKTVFAASTDAVPQMAPAVLIDVESGTASLASMFPNIKIVSYAESCSEWTKEHGNTEVPFPVYDWIMTLIDELRVDTTYKTVIIDSLTELQNMLMQAFLQADVITKPNKDPDIPSLQDYNKNASQVRRVVRALRDLDKNIIFTCLVRSSSSLGEDFVSKYIPAMTPKLAGEIAMFLDVVLHMYVDISGSSDEPIRKAMSRITPQYLAKDRFGTLPGVITNPTMKDIYDNTLGVSKSKGGGK
jgi:hypothetical protein